MSKMKKTKKTKKDTKSTKVKKKSTKKAIKKSVKNKKKNIHYTNGEVLSLVYDVWIGGKKLSTSKKACILGIEIKETVESSDVATIHLSDPNFEFINDSLMVEDKKIKISLGWSSVTYRATFEGYISAIDINFESSGVPSLTISCMDNTHRMNRTKKTKTYKKCTSADVVKKICKKYGFTCVVEKGYNFTKQDTISQSNQTDIDFIQSLAKNEVYPFTARLVGKKLYYVKKGKLKASKMTLTYRDYPHDIISFTPKINKETKQTLSSSKVSTSSKKTSSAKTTNSGSTKTSSSTKKTTGSAKKKTKSKKKYVYDPKTKKWSKK